MFGGWIVLAYSLFSRRIEAGGERSRGRRGTSATLSQLGPLNFDDEAFGLGLNRFLGAESPSSGRDPLSAPSRYERLDDGADPTGAIGYVGVPAT